MNSSRKAVAGALLSGLIFALGLGVSGMTQPVKVIGFLDVLGPAWDPSLALVMAGAIAVHLPLYRWLRGRPGAPPVVNSCGPVGDELSEETADAVGERRVWLPSSGILLGAAIFGVGWGLGGYCPGPALVSLPAGAPGVLVFILAMGVGMLIFDLGARRRLAPPPAARPIRFPSTSS